LTTPNLVANRPLASTRAIVISQSALLWIAILTPVVLVVHGYHPFADDAAIYISGVRKLVDPRLYKPDAAFVVAHTHFSIFAHLLTWVIRLTRLPLEFLLFTVHLGSIFLYLLACWTIAERLFPLLAQRWCAVALAAACFTLPIAGTALSLMDPYVTARSLSTPLQLFALAAAIDRRWSRCLVFLAAAAVLHPLMAVYAAAFVALFFLIDFGLPRAALVISAHGVALGTLIFFATRHFRAAPSYMEAIFSRRYLFPSRWTGVEDLGLIIPLLLFALAARRSRDNPLVRKLSLSACFFGITTTVIAFLFIHPSGSLLLARLQPLRSFHILYAVGVILLGGMIGSVFFGSKHGVRARWMAVGLLCVIAAIAFFEQRADYLLSAHVELPDTAPRNPWQQAFLWIGANTPQDAVFAANPGLIYVPGEDAQGFRAITGRSLLADDKDEGVVAVFPYLSREWMRQRNPQEHLDDMSDAQRRAELRPLGADWLLLSKSASTALPCPYRNAVAQVCRLQ
jgi:hypothetical protein